MGRSSIFPYYTQLLRTMRGVDVLDVEGAAMLHFNNVDEQQAQELKYPCRIDAVIMIVCVRGELSFSSHMSDYRLGENQLFLSSASVFQFKEFANSEFYIMAVSSDFMTKMNVDVRFVAHLISQLRANAHITTLGNEYMRGVGSLFDSLYAEHTTTEISYYAEHSLRHIFCAMIYRICDAVLGANVNMVPEGVKERSSEYFERLMTLLAEHYREHRNVEFYADKMHISSKHLSRVIRNFTGKSVHQWIDEFVALEIKNLLKYSNMSIQQISYSLNFPNPSFMGQYFKRITGMTPGEYKRS